MAAHSLPPEALRRFLAGTAGPGERKEIGRHLLQGCKVCRAFCRQLLGAQTHSLPSIGPSYDEAFEKAQQVVAQGLEVLEEPRRLLFELASHPFTRQEMLVRYHRRYWTYPFFEFLVRESYAERFSDLRQMQRLARLAVLVAQSLGRSPEGAEEGSASLVRAWLALGNALRVAGNLKGAEESLLRARRGIDSRPESLGLRADLLSHFSSLRCDQRRLDDAMVIGREDIAIRRDCYSPEDVARSLMRYSTALCEGGRPGEALGILREAEMALRATDNPRLNLIIRHNYIRFHLDDGKPELAYQLFSDLQPSYQEIAEPLIQAKTWWLNASILSALGHPEDASDLLNEALQHFLAQESPLEAAYVGLDCAVVLSRLGRKQEVRRLAAAALREFGARGIQRDYLAALILLRQAS